MKIKKIEQIEKIPVYDIMVENDNHYILENGIVSHNSGSQYSSDSVLLINKRQIKDSDNELEGFTFEINAKFSRFVKEKSKIPINVYFDRGIAPYSGLDEVAVDLKIVENGKIKQSKSLKYKDSEILVKNNDFNSEFWERVLEETDLKQLIAEKYKISKTNPQTIDEE